MTPLAKALNVKQIQPCPNCRMMIVWSGKPTKLLCAWCGKPLDGSQP